MFYRGTKSRNKYKTHVRNGLDETRLDFKKKRSNIA